MIFIYLKFYHKKIYFKIKLNLGEKIVMINLFGALFGKSNCECNDCDCLTLKSFDLTSKEGVEDAINFMENVKTNKVVTSFFDLLELDLNKVTENLYELLSTFENEDEEETCKKECECDEDEDEEYNMFSPFTYSENIPDSALDTINSLADEYVGDLIANDMIADDEEEIEYHKDILKDFASFVLLHD